MTIYIKENLKKKRKELGLSREKLAHLAGVTMQLVYRAEKTGQIYMTSYFKIHDVLENYVVGADYKPPYVSAFDVVFESNNN
jgi:predicted transcriptional regulator